MHAIAPTHRSTKLLRLTLAASSVLLTGCRQDMQNQPKFFPLRGTSFFVDGRSARAQVQGTIGRSEGDENSYLATGLSEGREGDEMPIVLTHAVLERGQERYNIYCSPCHSRVGTGDGMIVQRGYHQAANFHTERLRQAPLGHFINVMSHGWGGMPDYSAEITPDDRWAIAAYIRALQMSQYAKAQDASVGATILPLQEIAFREGLPNPVLVVRRQFKTVDQPPVVALSAPTSTSASADLKHLAVATLPATMPAGAHATTQEKQVLNQAFAPAVAAAGDAAAGKRIYAADCQLCHQATRAGVPPVIPPLVGIVGRVGTDHIRDTVANGIPTGKPPMPSFAGKLSEIDVNNLIEYLKQP